MPLLILPVDLGTGPSVEPSQERWGDQMATIGSHTKGQGPLCFPMQRVDLPPVKGHSAGANTDATLETCRTTVRAETSSSSPRGSWTPEDQTNPHLVGLSKGGVMDQKMHTEPDSGPTGDHRASWETRPCVPGCGTQAERVESTSQSLDFTARVAQFEPQYRD